MNSVDKRHQSQRIGVITALTMGRELTQKTLDTFHFAGIQSFQITHGMPRIQEIFSNSSSLEKVIYKISSDSTNEKLTFTSFEKIISDIFIIFSGDIRFERYWFTKWDSTFGFENIENDNSRNSVFLIIKIPVRLMLEFTVTIQDITKINWEDECFSPPLGFSMKPIAMSPYLVEEHHPNGYYADSEYDLYTEFVLQISYDLSILESVAKNNFQIESTSFNIVQFFLHKIWIPKIKNYKLFGLYSVEKVLETDDNKKIIICAPTSDISDFLHIDPYNIICNKASEMLKIFGIEVAKKCLIEELHQIMPEINKCYVENIVNVMTWGGNISSISRYASRRDPDPLKRMTFEETIRNCTIAAIKGEKDDLISSSSKIMVSNNISI